MNKHPETLVPIRFTDCDPLGHLNNARYLDYFFNTREDQVRQEYGLDFFTVAQTQGVSWVVGQSQIGYFKPANYGEHVVIQSQVLGFDNRSLLVEMRMFNAAKTSLKALLWVTFMHVNLRTQKLENHNPEFLELFRQILVAVEEKSFDQRMAAVLSANKATQEAQ